MPRIGILQSKFQQIQLVLNRPQLVVTRLCVLRVRRQLARYLDYSDSIAIVLVQLWLQKVLHPRLHCARHREHHRERTVAHLRLHRSSLSWIDLVINEIQDTASRRES